MPLVRSPSTPIDHAVLDEHLSALDHPGGKRAPLLHRGRRSPLGRPSRRASGCARMLAAATASCTARLTPTPPTGDIACAASPMQSRPGRYQRSQPVDRDGEELDLVPVRELADPVGEQRHECATVCAKAAAGRRASHRLDGALRDHVAALPVVAAIDQHEDAAGLEHPHGLVGGSSGLRRTRNHSTSIGAPSSRPRARRARAPSNGGRRSRPRGGPDLERAVRRHGPHPGHSARAPRSDRSPRSASRR